MRVLGGGRELLEEPDIKRADVDLPKARKYSCSILSGGCHRDLPYVSHTVLFQKHI
jgi:hypothetical protein